VFDGSPPSGAAGASVPLPGNTRLRREGRIHLEALIRVGEWKKAKKLQIPFVRFVRLFLNLGLIRIRVLK
jgi:hypothetical protein